MTPEEFLTREMSTCKHFDGIQHDTCLVGVSYSGLLQEGRRLPCIPQRVGDERLQAPCSQIAYPTREEAEAEQQRVEVIIAQRLADIQAGLCPHCRRKIESKRQVGPCIYAEPCGHRLGQGRLRKG